MKKVILAFLVVILAALSVEAGWWDKIIKRMMREGVYRVDNELDNAHTVAMGYDTYYLYPKAFTARYDIDVDLFLLPEKEIDVSEDVLAGKYGPVDFSQDVSDILSRSVSRPDRKRLVIETSEEYKIQAQTRIADYAERAKQIQKEVRQWTDVSIDELHGPSWETNAGIFSEKTAIMADNMALKVYMGELLALRTALTGELGLVGATNYAKEVMDSLNSYLEIYRMAR